MGKFLTWLILGMLGYFRMKKKISPPEKNVTKKRADKKYKPQKPSIDLTDSQDMVEDKICGTYMDKNDAIKLIHHGNIHYFCSEKCKKEFLEK
jgi:YHS domain-containing protein